MKKLSDYQKVMQVIEAKGIKIQDAETMCGLGTTTLQKLKSRNDGQGKLHKDNLEKFLRTFHVDRNWWDTGEGDIFKAQPPPSEVVAVPFRVWERLERNFNNFEKNSELFGQVIEKEGREKADLSKKNDELVSIIRDFISGQIQTHKV